MESMAIRGQAGGERNDHLRHRGDVWSVVWWGRRGVTDDGRGASPYVIDPTPR